MLDPIALPDEVRNLAGRIIDVDSHEMIPAQLWVEMFGPECRELAEAFTKSDITDVQDKNASNIPDYPGDILPIDASIVNIKGARAPGATDLDRRLTVMDAMGIGRQYMYPTSVGLWAALLLCSHEDPLLLKNIQGDRPGKAKTMIKAYNKWMMQQVGRSPRIRPVPPVCGDTVEELTEMTRELLEAGIRAIWMPAGLAPGGRSPAHPDLDPYWAMLVEHDCVVTAHVGTENKFFAPHAVWRDAPVFEGYRALGEISTDPWYLSHMHIPVQSFLMTMITGGVFVRHPKLRVLITELGAYWVGPMMEAMDIWHANLGAFAPHDQALKVTPSSFVHSNIRVAPFSFENVASYIERYGLEDVLCFSSDYPHVEGGRDALRAFYRNIEHLGPQVVEKFFAANAEFVFPD